LKATFGFNKIFVDSTADETIDGYGARSIKATNGEEIIGEKGGKDDLKEIE